MQPLLKTLRPSATRWCLSTLQVCMTPEPMFTERWVG